MLTEVYEDCTSFSQSPHTALSWPRWFHSKFCCFFSECKDCWLVRYDAVQFGIVCQRRTTITRLPGVAYLNTVNVGRIQITFLHPISLVTIYPPVCFYFLITVSSCQGFWTMFSFRISNFSPTPYIVPSFTSLNFIIPIIFLYKKLTGTFSYSLSQCQLSPWWQIFLWTTGFPHPQNVFLQ